jgi:uncharacterized iron-regulated membrane protein
MFTEGLKTVLVLERHKWAAIRRTAAIASVAAAGSLWLATGLARPAPEQPTVLGSAFKETLIEAAPVQRRGVSLQEAVRAASARYPGRVVRAVTITEHGRPVHEIRILLDDGGRVVTVHVDAQTGQMR